MADFERARQIKVDTQIRPSDVTDRRILSVMGKVQRELFVPDARRELAYIDEMHPLLGPGSGRYMPAPASFARIVQLASIRPTDSILDAGCGSGYSTAVLAGLGKSVIAVTPPENGVPDRAPFDVIIVEGTVERVPQALIAQLAADGRLVAVLRKGITAVAHLYVNTGREVSGRAEFNVSLPPLETTRRPEEFVF